MKLYNIEVDTSKSVADQIGSYAEARGMEVNWKDTYSFVFNWEGIPRRNERTVVQAYLYETLSC